MTITRFDVTIYDEFDDPISVECSYYPGRPATRLDPPDPEEIEIEMAWSPDGHEIELTEEQQAQVLSKAWDVEF